VNEPLALHSSGRESGRARVTLGALARTAAVIAVGTAVANAGVWRIGETLGRMTIGVGEVLVGSAVGVAAGAVALLVASRITKRPKRAFVIASSVVLVLYALGPVSAALAPYREGAELFNVTTVLATELMHLVSGLVIMAAFTRSAVLVPAPPPPL